MYLCLVDEAGEQPSDNQQDKEFGEPNIDEELSDQYDTSEIEPQPVDELVSIILPMKCVSQLLTL